jgi:Tfp pilus assembly protein PilF
VPALLALAILFLFLSVVGASTAEPAATAPDGFVRAHRGVSTASADAQAAFDDGLTLLYAFNPEQARVSFRRALDADPSLAIAWWGVAMSYGINLNTDFDPDGQRAGRAATAKAHALEGRASPVERALIGAAAARFAFDRSGDADRSARAYRDAMDAVAATYPADDDVQTLAAEAEMDVHAWAFFTTDGAPIDGMLATIERLRLVLARDPEHIGANHLLIHALEESPHPEEALPAARRLAAERFEPAAEHLEHMPAHDFMRVGMYHEAGVANERAIASYDEYLASEHAGHQRYYGHDCLLGVDAFMMAGEYARARSLATTCSRGGGLVSIVDLRFGRYDELSRDENLGAFAAGMLAAHDGRNAVAKAQLAILRKENEDVGVISASVLAAALARRDGDASAEIATLERAAGVQDREGYAEPPEFWWPVRESLGAADARAGRYGDAERAFRSVLEHDRDDPRALFGLARTLEREGRAAEAGPIDERFASAWRQADVQLDLKDL